MHRLPHPLRPTDIWTIFLYHGRRQARAVAKRRVTPFALAKRLPRTSRLTSPMISAFNSPLRDELGDEIGAETFNAALAAVAGFLDAAERRFRRRDRDRVDADHAGFERVADRGGRRGRRREGIGR